MTRLIAFALCTLLATPLVAQAADDPAATLTPGSITAAQDLTLDALLWVARPVVVFADTPADPRFQQQIAMFEAELEKLAERDVVVLTDADPAAMESIRAQLRPRGFQMVLIGKDGRVALRKPFPYSVRELTRSIDKMPMRQQEIRDRRAATPAASAQE